MPKKIFIQELEGTRRRGRPRKGWREEVERDLQVLGVRRWRELVIGKKGEVLFDRPKPTAGCSANGRRRYRLYLRNAVTCYVSVLTLSFHFRQNPVTIPNTVNRSLLQFLTL